VLRTIKTLDNIRKIGLIVGAAILPILGAISVSATEVEEPRAGGQQLDQWAEICGRDRYGNQMSLIGNLDGIPGLPVDAANLTNTQNIVFTRNLVDQLTATMGSCLTASDAHKTMESNDHNAREFIAGVQIIHYLQSDKKLQALFVDYINNFKENKYRYQDGSEMSFEEFLKDAADFYVAQLFLEAIQNPNIISKYPKEIQSLPFNPSDLGNVFKRKPNTQLEKESVKKQNTELRRTWVKFADLLPLSVENAIDNSGRDNDDTRKLALKVKIFKSLNEYFKNFPASENTGQYRLLFNLYKYIDETFDSQNQTFMTDKLMEIFTSGNRFYDPEFRNQALSITNYNGEKRKSVYANLSAADQAIFTSHQERVKQWIRIRDEIQTALLKSNPTPEIGASVRK
jgi:hypothetical protein